MAGDGGTSGRHDGPSGHIESEAHVGRQLRALDLQQMIMTLLTIQVLKNYVTYVC